MADKRLIGVSGNFTMTEGNRKCGLCDKLFIAYGSEWAYKDRDKWFCSWKCLRRWQNENKCKRSKRSVK